MNKIKRKPEAAGTWLEVKQYILTWPDFLEWPDGEASPDEWAALQEKQRADILTEIEKEKAYKDKDILSATDFFTVLGYLRRRLIELNPGDPLQKKFIEVSSSQLYHNFRSKIATGAFNMNQGGQWPEADLSGKDLTGQVHVKPDREAPVIGNQALQELQEAMRERVTALAKQGDLAADVFDTITAKWLREKDPSDAMITITADDILQARGLEKNISGCGERGGYKEKQRKEIQRQIDILSYTWITVQEMEVIEVVDGKRKKTKWRGESKAIALTSRFGQIKIDGSTDAFAWRVRPGDVFTKFLDGPGRQTALLSCKALDYDPYRQKWEKRLARYLAWIWRISSGRTQEGLLIKTLLDAAGAGVNKRFPGRTRDRLEEALDRLQADDVISAWEYDCINEEVLSGRGWAKKWLECKVTITAPAEILKQYSLLKKITPKKKKKA